jgi:hypothetical protein
MTLMVLLIDARELFKVLAERQSAVPEKLEPALARLPAGSMESILHDARAKAQKIESDVQKLTLYIADCDAMA